MATIKPDTTLTAAVDLARAAAEEIAEPGAVGEHRGVVMEGERVATHRFACLSAGYPDWLWSITVTRVARSRHVTVSETHLLPGETSIVAPPWVPYEERIAPGDLGPGDVNPYVEEDPNLEPGFEATGDEDVDQMAQWELGLGRPRVLSAEGREDAAQRWYDGDSGPAAEVARQAPARCTTCGYYLPMAGVLRRTFGVCANAWSPSDGRVVSLDHGCGAHSEVDMDRPAPRPLDPPVVDDLAVDLELAALVAGEAGDQATAAPEVEETPEEEEARLAQAMATVTAVVERALAEAGARGASDPAQDETVEDEKTEAGLSQAGVSQAVEVAVAEGTSAQVVGEPEADAESVARVVEAAERAEAVDAAAQAVDDQAAAPPATTARRGRRSARRAAGAPAGPPSSTEVLPATSDEAAQEVATADE